MCTRVPPANATKSTNRNVTAQGWDKAFGSESQEHLRPLVQVSRVVSPLGFIRDEYLLGPELLRCLKSSCNILVMEQKRTFPAGYFYPAQGI